MCSIIVIESGKVKRCNIHEENNKKSRCIPLLLLWVFVAYTKVNTV